MHGNYSYKIKYIQAYIHHMKHASVQIRLPQSQREEHLMNHAYTIAKSTMNKMGKEINV
jgi:hypothetical protein